MERSSFRSPPRRGAQPVALASPSRSPITLRRSVLQNGALDSSKKLQQRLLRRSAAAWGLAERRTRAAAQANGGARRLAWQARLSSAWGRLRAAESRVSRDEERAWPEARVRAGKRRRGAAAALERARRELMDCDGAVAGWDAADDEPLAERRLRRGVCAAIIQSSYRLHCSRQHVLASVVVLRLVHSARAIQRHWKLAKARQRVNAGLRARKAKRVVDGYKPEDRRTAETDQSIAVEAYGMAAWREAQERVQRLAEAPAPLLAPMSPSRDSLEGDSDDSADGDSLQQLRARREALLKAKRLPKSAKPRAHAPKQRQRPGSAHPRLGGGRKAAAHAAAHSAVHSSEVDFNSSVLLSRQVRQREEQRSDAATAAAAARPRSAYSRPKSAAAARPKSARPVDPWPATRRPASARPRTKSPSRRARPATARPATAQPARSPYAKWRTAPPLKLQLLRRETEDRHNRSDRAAAERARKGFEGAGGTNLRSIHAELDRSMMQLAALATSPRTEKNLRLLSQHVKRSKRRQAEQAAEIYRAREEMGRARR